MSYTFLRLTTLYNSILKKHYQGNDLTKLTNYDDAFNYLINEEYALSDAYERSLKKLYDVRSEIIFANDFFLQSKWAKEHNLTLEGKELVLEQVKFYQPCVIMIEDLYWVDEGFINSLRKLSFVKVIFAHHCSPHTNQIIKNMLLLDFVVSCSPFLIEEYKRNGIKNTFLIYHAFDSNILGKIEKQRGVSADVVFIGSLITGKDFHDARKELVEYLASEKIKLKIYSEDVLFSQKQKRAYIIYSNLSKVIGKNKSGVILKKIKLGFNFIDQTFWNSLRPFLNPPLYGLEMYAVLQNSKICINNHGGVAGKYGANMRLFETTGVGTCLLTDDKQNMNELFTPGLECVTYKNKTEAKEKINWLLTHPDDLATIARAGQERCLKDHTYDSRAKQLNGIILKFL